MLRFFADVSMPSPELSTTSRDRTRGLWLRASWEPQGAQDLELYGPMLPAAQDLRASSAWWDLSVLGSQLYEPLNASLPEAGSAWADARLSLWI